MSEEHCPAISQNAKGERKCPVVVGLKTQLETLRTKLAKAESVIRRKDRSYEIAVQAIRNLRTDLAASKGRIYTEKVMSAMQHERDAFCKQNLENCKVKNKRIKELGNYTSHWPDCEMEIDGGDAKCSCGLQQALNPKEKQTKNKPRF